MPQSGQQYQIRKGMATQYGSRRERLCVLNTQCQAAEHVAGAGQRAGKDQFFTCTCQRHIQDAQFFVALCFFYASLHAVPCQRGMADQLLSVVQFHTETRFGVEQQARLDILCGILGGESRYADEREFEAFRGVDAHNTHHVGVSRGDLRRGNVVVLFFQSVQIAYERRQSAKTVLFKRAGLFVQQLQIGNALMPVRAGGSDGRQRGIFVDAVQQPIGRQRGRQRAITGQLL